MARYRTIWLRLLLALVATVASGAASAETKIGYVDWKAVLENAPQIAVARAKLDAEFRQRNTELQAEQVRLDDLEQRLRTEGPLMSADQANEMEREVRNLRRNLAADRDELADKLDFRLGEERQQVEEQIFEVVRAFAVENGYDLIMPGPVLYVSDGINLTEQISLRLRAGQSVSNQ